MISNSASMKSSRKSLVYEPKTSEADILTLQLAFSCNIAILFIHVFESSNNQNFLRGDKGATSVTFFPFLSTSFKTDFHRRYCCYHLKQLLIKSGCDE